jgi:hypothetical protein
MLEGGEFPPLSTLGEPTKVPGITAGQSEKHGTQANPELRSVEDGRKVVSRA